MGPHGEVIGERTPDGNDWYYLKDGVGSVVGVISGSGGTVGNRYAYDPFGKSTCSSGSVAKPWRFASGYLDPTGLYKFGTRYYDPSVGRWTQQDPISGGIANPSTVNRYPYVNGDSVNYNDATGAFNGGEFGFGFLEAFDALWLGWLGSATIAASVAGAPESGGLSLFGLIPGTFVLIASAGSATFAGFAFYHSFAG